MAQTGTLSKCTDGLEPSYISKFPSGGDVSRSAALSIVGSTSHGDAAFITSQDGRFLFGEAPSQYHAELAGDFYYNGTQTDESLAWGTSSFTVETTGLRAASVGAMYKGLGASRLTNPLSTTSIPASSTNMYFSYHTKFGSDPFRTMMSSVASKTGDLQGGVDRARGERVTVTLADASVAQGWVTYENGSYVTVEFDGSVATANFQGATILGQTSGNTVITGAEASGIVATKYYRMFHGGISEDNRSLFIRSHTSGGNADFDTFSGGVLDNHQDVDTVNNGRCPVGEWAFFESEWVYSGGIWQWQNRVNGQVWSTSSCPAVLGTEAGLRPTLLGLDLPGTGGLPAEQCGASEFIDSIVYQTDTKRVVLTDNAAYSSSTKFEVQRHLYWNKNGIQIQVNRGEISSGGYFHVFNNYGSVIGVVEA